LKQFTVYFIFNNILILFVSSEPDEACEQVAKIIETKYSYFEPVGIIGAGGSFGEVALLTENAKRTATVVTMEESYFMTLRRDAFNELIGLYKEGQLVSQLNFLR
jgi:CRP-like cAMP-binding protein